jgi:hypothetical protein
MEKRVKTINKFKRRWLTRFNPDAISYQTAIDAAYFKPEHAFSQQAADMLGDAYIKVDRQLKHGFSRQLIINILTRVSNTLNCNTLPLLDEPNDRRGPKEVPK